MALDALRVCELLNVLMDYAIPPTPAAAALTLSLDDVATAKIKGERA